MKTMHDIGMQDKGIADKDWVHQIQKQEGSIFCDVSWMNWSVSGKYKYEKNEYVSPANKE